MRREVTRSWWYTTIRGIQLWVYRNWHVVWLLFLLALVLWYFLCYRPYCSHSSTNDNAAIDRLSNINQLLDSCCGLTSSDSGLHFPADFMIITYHFDSEGGKDLDTRTEIISPVRDGPFGYCNGGNGKEGRFMMWSGDNTGYGVESVLIDLTKFNANDFITIDCRAFWFSVLNSGNMYLNIKAYEGGRMDLRDYQFFNVGGRLSAEKSFKGNITVCCGRSSCQNISKIGVVKYDKRQKKLFFEPSN